MKRASVRLTIGELARRTGIGLSTVRYYERAGLLPRPGRTASRRQAMKAEICMPYIRVKDARASLDYYERCLGFRKVSEHRFATGLPLCIGIERGKLRFLLTEHTGDGAFGICVYCYINDDVDEFCDRCRAAGARIIQELEDMPWARDFSVKDLDGNVIRFGNRKK